MHAGPPSPGFQNELYWGKIHNPSAIGPSEVGAGKAYRAAATDIKERAATRLRRATRAGKFVYGRHAEGAGLLGRAGAALHGGEAFLKHLNSNLDNIIQFGIKKN
jgi:hypothetical protein